MKAKLFDGREIEFSGNEVEKIRIEYNDYSILIDFKQPNIGGWETERAESIRL